MCKCNHDGYWSEFADGKMVHCFGCHQSWTIEPGVRESGRMVVDRPCEPLVLPPQVRPLRADDWLERWPNVTPELTIKYGWYVAEIQSAEASRAYEYLVMPIYRGGAAVFYSARALDSRAPKKYHYPSGVKREYWLSEDMLPRDPLFICEGVADAVALSQYGSTAALLGAHYDGRLDSLLEARRVIIAFDGDFQGRMLAIQAAYKMKTAKVVKLAIVHEKDPTSWTRGEIENALEGLNG